LPVHPTAGRDFGRKVSNFGLVWDYVAKDVKDSTARLLVFGHYLSSLFKKTTGAPENARKMIRLRKSDLQAKPPI
jgi:hypothetical protein